MAPKGVAIFKFNEHNTGFLPNRKMILWPYTNLSDSRLFLGNKYFSLNMDPKKHAPIKLGLDNHIAKAAYLLNGYKFTIFHSHNHPGCYPDGGASLETYTNQHFLEIETLSKLMKLRPKNSITHVEK
jgi:hypothetical protein